MLEQSASVLALGVVGRGRVGAAVEFSAKPHPRYAHQWTDNVKMKFDPSIPCGSRVMIIFTN